MLHNFFKVSQRQTDVPELGLLNVVEAIFSDGNRTDHTLLRTSSDPVQDRLT